MVTTWQTFKSSIFINACSSCIHEILVSEIHAKLPVPSSDKVPEVGLSATTWVNGAVLYGAVHLNTTNYVQSWCFKTQPITANAHHAQKSKSKVLPTKHHLGHHPLLPPHKIHILPQCDLLLPQQHINLLWPSPLLLHHSNEPAEPLMEQLLCGSAYSHAGSVAVVRLTASRSQKTGLFVDFSYCNLL